MMLVGWRPAFPRCQFRQRGGCGKAVCAVTNMAQAPANWGSEVSNEAAKPAQLDIHPATAAEREASFHNTHDVWSRGLPLDEHVALRLKSPLHGRAQWFVGTIDGLVVTSLAAHPLEFQLRGEPLKGFGIGSVHTLAAYRRRGLAPQLLAWVEDYRRQQGDHLSLLYSDIDPNFYAKLGYWQAPAWCGWRDLPQVPSDAEDSQSAAPVAGKLVPFDGRQEVDAMAAMYAACHGTRPLSIVRGPEYWAHLFERQPADEYLWLDGPAGDRLGYVRLKRKGADLSIADYAFSADAFSDGAVPAASDRSAVDESHYELLYRLLAEYGQQQGAARIGGWLPDLSVARRWFQLAPRSDEIPMFKSLAPTVVLDDESIARTDCFCELDHV